MTLDPQAAAHLEALAAQRVRPIHRLDVPAARAAAWAYLDQQRPPRPVAAVTNRFIGGPSADLPIRLYRPYAHQRITPAIVMFHGSGWVIGNIDVCDEPARALALDTGYPVITVNYQKAPEHPYPVPLDDCVAAFAWVVANAEQLHIDASQIAVVGDSCGGNLAAALTLRVRNSGATQPAAVGLIYPALAYRFDTDSYRRYDRVGTLARADMEWFWAHYLGPDPARGADAYASPLLAEDLAGLPPAYIATAECDVLRDDGWEYAARLRAAGVEVSITDYPGMVHGFYWMDAVLDQSRTLQRALAGWLSTTLGPLPSA